MANCGSARARDSAVGRPSSVPPERCVSNGLVDRSILRAQRLAVMMTTRRTSPKIIMTMQSLPLDLRWFRSAFLSSTTASPVLPAAETTLASMSSIIPPCCWTRTARSAKISLTSPISFWISCMPRSLSWMMASFCRIWWSRALVLPDLGGRGRRVLLVHGHGAAFFVHARELRFLEVPEDAFEVFQQPFLPRSFASRGGHGRLSVVLFEHLGEFLGFIADAFSIFSYASSELGGVLGGSQPFHLSSEPGHARGELEQPCFGLFRRVYIFRPRLGRSFPSFSDSFRFDGRVFPFPTVRRTRKRSSWLWLLLLLFPQVLDVPSRGQLGRGFLFAVPRIRGRAFHLGHPPSFSSLPSSHRDVRRTRTMKLMVLIPLATFPRPFLPFLDRLVFPSLSHRKRTPKGNRPGRGSLPRPMVPRGSQGTTPPTPMPLFGR
eukprot:scaffold1440_cov332-Pavlova_lutheri.AAC.68